MMGAGDDGSLASLCAANQPVFTAVTERFRGAIPTVLLFDGVPRGRGIGVTELLHGHAPWILVVLFAVITQLGDVWFLFLVAGLLYIGGEAVPRFHVSRPEGLFVLAMLLTYLALIGVLKDVLLLPRPPGAIEPPPLRWVPPLLDGIFTSITTADGPGFPSGHAVGTTMVWGSLALVIDRGRLASRVGLAATVVGLVSLSRLILGVHYLVDVVGGALLGVVVLGGLYLLASRGTEPARVLFAAVVIGVLGMWIDPTFDSVAAIGGAFGAWVVWRFLAEATPAHPSKKGEVRAALLIAITGSLCFAVVYILGLPHLLTFLGTMVAAGLLVAAPFLGDRVVA